MKAAAAGLVFVAIMAAFAWRTMQPDATVNIAEEIVTAPASREEASKAIAVETAASAPLPHQEAATIEVAQAAEPPTLAPDATISAASAEAREESKNGVNSGNMDSASESSKDHKDKSVQKMLEASAAGVVAPHAASSGRSNMTADNLTKRRTATTPKAATAPKETHIAQPKPSHDADEDLLAAVLTHVVPEAKK